MPIPRTTSGSTRDEIDMLRIIELPLMMTPICTIYHWLRPDDKEGHADKTFLSLPS